MKIKPDPTIRSFAGKFPKSNLILQNLYGKHFTSAKHFAKPNTQNVKDRQANFKIENKILWNIWQLVNNDFKTDLQTYLNLLHSQHPDELKLKANPFCIFTMLFYFASQLNSYDLKNLTLNKSLILFKFLPTIENFIANHYLKSVQIPPDQPVLNHSIFTQIFPIKHTAGLLDFSISGVTNPVWLFPSGDTSESNHPAKEVSSGYSYLVCDNFNIANVELNDNSTDEKYLGDLADLPNLSYYLNLYNCNQITGNLADLPNLSYYLNLYNCNQITGNLADLPNLSYYLKLYNCNQITGNLADLPNLSCLLNLAHCNQITGDLADLPNLSYYLNLYNCNQITGNLADLPNLSYYLNLANCNQITGILNPTATLSNIDISNTNLSSTDLSQSFVNLKNITTTTGTFTATGICTYNELTQNGKDAYDGLIAMGWTITLDS